MTGRKNDVTAILAELAAGERPASHRTAVDALFPLVYDELRAMAQRQLRGQAPGQTLNTTALVHEAYVKLANPNEVRWQDRAHFLSVAATAMRQILIDHARRVHTDKRGGGVIMVTFDESFMRGDTARAEQLLALEDALQRLAQQGERPARVVEYRFFGGLTHEEIAEVLAVSVPTVRRDWQFARAWLSRELADPSSTSAPP